MNPAFTIWRRESKSLLRSPVAWCVFAGFVAANGIRFTAALRQAEGTVESLPAVLCSQLLLTLCIPTAFFTMGLFATEKSTGTLETLITAPVTDAQVVIGKFLAACSTTWLAIAFATLIFPITLKLAALPPAFSTLSLYGGLAAVAFYAATWCALGTLISLLSNHQAPAGVATLGTTLVWATIATDSLPDFARTLIPIHYDVADFARGIVDTRFIFVAISSLVFLLFCAVRILESRRWSSTK